MYAKYLQPGLTIQGRRRRRRRSSSSSSRRAGHRSGASNRLATHAARHVPATQAAQAIAWPLTQHGTCRPREQRKRTLGHSRSTAPAHHGSSTSELLANDTARHAPATGATQAKIWYYVMSMCFHVLP